MSEDEYFQNFLSVYDGKTKGKSNALKLQIMLQTLNNFNIKSFSEASLLKLKEMIGELLNSDIKEKFPDVKIEILGLIIFGAMIITHASYLSYLVGILGILVMQLNLINPIVEYARKRHINKENVQGLGLVQKNVEVILQDKERCRKATDVEFVEVEETKVNKAYLNKLLEIIDVYLNALPDAQGNYFSSLIWPFRQKVQNINLDDEDEIELMAYALENILTDLSVLNNSAYNMAFRNK